MRRAGLILAMLLIVIAAAWSAAWFYAAAQAGARADAWMEAERAAGRTWTCPNRKVGGFPFSLAIACSEPTFVGQARDQRVEASLARLVASVGLDHPRQIALALEAPFTFKTSDGGTAVQATWKSLSAELGPLPEIGSLFLRGSGLALGGTFAGTAAEGRTDGLAARFTLQSAQPDPSLAFDVALQGAIVPPLDALLDGTAAADLAVAGRLEHADAGDARTPEEAMETWRRAGGRVVIDRSAASRAGARASATGTLGLDDAHRIEGRLDAEFIGLEAILRRYGISGNVAAVGSLVSALLGGGPPKSPHIPGAVDLPISFARGRVGVGPITTPVRLSPLY